MTPTTNPIPRRDNETEADYARRRGWGVGTRLTGDEGRGPETIEISALGHTKLLAFDVGKGPRTEASWTLDYRDWQEVPTPHDPWSAHARDVLQRFDPAGEIKYLQLGAASGEGRNSVNYITREGCGSSWSGPEPSEGGVLARDLPTGLAEFVVASFDALKLRAGGPGNGVTDQ